MELGAWWPLHCSYPIRVAFEELQVSGLCTVSRIPELEHWIGTYKCDWSNRSTWGNIQHYLVSMVCINNWTSLGIPSSNLCNRAYQVVENRFKLMWMKSEWVNIKIAYRMIPSSCHNGFFLLPCNRWHTASVPLQTMCWSDHLRRSQICYLGNLTILKFSFLCNCASIVIGVVRSITRYVMKSLAERPYFGCSIPASTTAGRLTRIYA